MNSNSIFLLFELILILSSQIYTQTISIPFKFDILGHNFYNYNSTYFLNEYFKKEIFLQLIIGSPAQEINSKINQDSECFLLKNDIFNSKSKKYFPNNSSSFFKKKDLIIYNPYKYAEDIFHFPKINNNTKLSFLLENYTNSINESYIPEIGLNIPFISIGNICPNFILDLKNGKIINKLIWSLKYNYKYDGEFIIGDELSEYDKNKYIKDQYSTIYINSNYIINFDLIYIPEKQYFKKNNNNLIKEKFNITSTHLHINSGLIIGTNEYKNYIDKNFFNRLVNRSICKIDTIKIQKNEDKLYNNDYYVYSCYSRHFTGQTSARFPTTNYYEEFPNLVFSSKKLEYNFELTKEYLFEKISDIYYFLIIFKKNINLGEKEMWELGEPFYRKYTFSINIDAKTIGFYIEKEKNENKINSTNNANNKTKNILNQNKNKIIRFNIIKYLIEILVIICLLFIAYYIGVTVRDRRRKRANELKDDNYEYLPEKNSKDINDKKTDSKNQKLVELNSKIGL